jgi:hypothetical protein
MPVNTLSTIERRQALLGKVVVQRRERCDPVLEDGVVDVSRADDLRIRRVAVPRVLEAEDRKPLLGREPPAEVVRRRLEPRREPGDEERDVELHSSSAAEGTWRTK